MLYGRFLAACFYSEIVHYKKNGYPFIFAFLPSKVEVLPMDAAVFVRLFSCGYASKI